MKCVRSALEMEASKEEQRDVARFLLAEGTGTREIHIRMSAVFGEHCMSLTNVHKWQKRFREGRTSLQEIRAWDRVIESLRLMKLRRLMVLSGKTDELQRNKFVFRSVEEVQEWARLWFNQRPTSFYNTLSSRLPVG